MGCNCTYNALFQKITKNRYYNNSFTAFGLFLSTMGLKNVIARERPYQHRRSIAYS